MISSNARQIHNKHHHDVVENDQLQDKSTNFIPSLYNQTAYAKKLCKP